MIIEGRSKHWLEGEDEEMAEAHGPGTYFFQPANQPHSDAVPGDEPVTIFLYFPGPIDFIPTE